MILISKMLGSFFAIYFDIFIEFSYIVIISPFVPMLFSASATLEKYFSIIVFAHIADRVHDASTCGFSIARNSIVDM